MSLLAGRGEMHFTDLLQMGQTKYSISQIQLNINQLVEVLRLISSGAVNCAPTLEREMLKPISRGDRVRGRPPFVTVFAK